MNRRRLLSLFAAAGSVSGAGCLGVLDDSVPCERTEDERTLEESMDLIDVPGKGSPTLTFGGTVVEVDESSLVFYDGTGVGRLYTDVGEEFNLDRLGSGDCITGDGHFEQRSSWDEQRPVIAVSSLEKRGTTEDPLPESITDREPPAGSFSVETEPTGGISSCGRTVTFTMTGDEPVPAESVEILYGREREGVRRPTRANTTRRSWASLVDGAETIDPDDSTSIELYREVTGTIVWRSESGWNHEYTTWNVSLPFHC